MRAISVGLMQITSADRVRTANTIALGLIQRSLVAEQSYFISIILFPLLPY